MPSPLPVMIATLPVYRIMSSRLAVALRCWDNAGRRSREGGHMQRFAFKMYLNAGQRDEYQRRHDEIWPELSALLREAGVSNYSIYLDDETSILFAYLERTDDHRMAELPNEAVMRRWWDFMADIMRYENGVPVAIPLPEVFHMD
jgi:L-rhamnose mutarotase